mmetsp:Transcript_24551/g.53541  ORF Transcript_24551/g.53541 Transcript_24551/m.53541 type:complete len:135 (-) Transcript_24551:125-529(-)
MRQMTLMSAMKDRSRRPRSSVLFPTSDEFDGGDYDDGGTNGASRSSSSSSSSRSSRSGSGRRLPASRLFADDDGDDYHNDYYSGNGRASRGSANANANPNEDTDEDAELLDINGDTGNINNNSSSSLCNSQVAR